MVRGVWGGGNWERSHSADDEWVERLEGAKQSEVRTSSAQSLLVSSLAFLNSL